VKLGSHIGRATPAPIGEFSREWGDCGAFESLLSHQPMARHVS
jgi:hypothetical protein